MAEDGETQGNLQIRTHWIVGIYFEADSAALTEDGWFDAGDVVTIDNNG